MVGVGFDPKEREKAAVKAIEAKIAPPSGMKFERYEYLITEMVREGLPFDKISQVIANVAKGVNPENNNAFFDNNLLLASTAATEAAAAGEAPVGGFLKDNFVDAMFDSTIDLVGRLAGFNVHNKHDRDAIRGTLKLARSEAQKMFTDPAMQQSMAEFIFSGAAGLAKGSIDKLGKIAKAIIDAIHGLTGDQLQKLGEIAKSGNIPQAAGFLYDQDKGKNLPTVGSRDDFIHNWIEHHEVIHNRINRVFDPHPSPDAPHPQLQYRATRPGDYRAALTPGLATDKPNFTAAADKPGASAAALNKPSTKYAALPHAPGIASV